MHLTRILVADDHDVVRRGLCSLIASQATWRVCAEAVDGKEAVERTAAVRPDVAVIDAIMPQMDGLAATRAIRERSAATEVCIFTMHETDELIADVISSGARGFVLKSDPSRYLLAAIEALARHVPYLTPSVSDALVSCFGKRNNHAVGGVSPLTVREREVVRLLASGHGNKGVAAALAISVKTVESHRANIMRKLELDSIAGLVHYAVRNRLVEA
jgi:DNA-binding NarL/FixJ family response regulator